MLTILVKIIPILRNATFIADLQTHNTGTSYTPAQCLYLPSQIILLISILIGP
jgi:hypothetical protein